MTPVDAYATQVVAGTVPAGKYHRLSCARHLRDRTREASVSFPYRFDWARAERFLRFAGQLKHYKGEWAGQPIVLQPYQVFRLGSLFGWVQMTTGLRRFRTAYNELPRKQGKSLEAAVVALYATFFDGEPGAEGYTSATKRDQAKIVFADCKKLVQSSGLKTRIKVQVSNLHAEASASKLEPLGADHDSTDGLNPHLIIVDEFHAHKDRGLIDVLETATGARRQPITFQITTAGNDPVSPCGDQHDYACKILDGLQVDETFFAFIAHADAGDDWLDERTWAKANPNYGVSVQPDDMRALAVKAQAMPAAAATFRQKRLNEWVNADTPWLSMDGWRRGQTSWAAESLEHQPCYIGIDLASKIDLCALVALFPPTEDRETWRLLKWAWTPAVGLVDRARRDRAPYGVWVEQGYLLTTPGERIDHGVIRRTIAEIRTRYDIEAIGFDPWHADKLIDELVTVDGYDEAQVVAVPQTYAGMSNACLHFEAEVLEGRVDAGGDPLMAWCVSNAVVQRDGKDNIYPVKKRSKGRIDPLMAAIVARRLASVAPPANAGVEAWVIG
jgi:phage terminase large subunit-like protein